MTKRTKIIISCAAFCVILIGVLTLCLGSASRQARIAVKKYNEIATTYNVAVNAYNRSLDMVEKANVELDVFIESGKALIESGAIPFDNQCKINLEQAIQMASQECAFDSTRFPIYEEMIVPKDATDEQLWEIAERATFLIEQMEATIVPAPLLEPDYTEVKALVQSTIAAFERSVLIQRQVTAPKDEFAINCLKQIDTVLAMGAVTKSNDPNGLLGTEGGYIGCIYFSDSRVDKEKLDLKPGNYNVIKMGNAGGGAVEVYATVEDAEARNLYLTTFDNTDLKPGSHCVVGTVVVRTSPYLTDEQQSDLTSIIIELMTMLAV